MVGVGVGVRVLVAMRVAVADGVRVGVGGAVCAQGLSIHRAPSRTRAVAIPASPENRADAKRKRRLGILAPQMGHT